MKKVFTQDHNPAEDVADLQECESHYSRPKWAIRLQTHCDALLACEVHISQVFIVMSELNLMIAIQ
jgi:hypothetical protein